ncbi:transposase [[Clostridium] innocuum]|nr:transposase [[Clostridium] innocuum]MCR0260902.1 transposase [[Clostridium] innocuum]MCR0502763.1 transposase [[Clostridium] innocuum]
MEKYHKGVRDNIESEEGKKIIAQRSIQAEGVFANLKQDYGIDCHIIWERKV